MKIGSRPPPGDDVTTVPPPLDEAPPAGRFCDLVLTGGVASGVVYPWAVVELARAFHFRSIGGSSVGALAASLAAAAEYGRRNGYQNAFEPLRRTPEQLAEVLPDGRTRMLSLFQPLPQGQRLLDLVVTALGASKGGAEVNGGTLRAVLGRLRSAYRLEWHRGAIRGGVFAVLLSLTVALIGWLPGFLLAPRVAIWTWLDEGALQLGNLVGGLFTALFAGLVVVLAGALVGAFAGLVRGVRADLRAGLLEHNFGLCAGASADQDPERVRERPGLTDWLHEGIQRSAGLTLEDPPLTFRDLWLAPMEPGSMQRGTAEPTKRAIDLQMITSNVTHMRPYCLPLTDRSSKLYFRPDELRPYFPPSVIAALMKHCIAYSQARSGEPPTSRGEGLYELPEADLPIVVAARLSLSFPLLFCAVPLHAVDFERPQKARDFCRCWFSDGGLCSNFPIHLFDAAVPRHPTFGMWLDQRGPYFEREAVWLPEDYIQGCGDAWQRFDKDDPASTTVDGSKPGPWRRMARFLIAAGVTAKDWGDRTALRMPQTRHRVARLFLVAGEGELNIAMGREVILKMAREYGTRTGRLFVRRYAAAPGAGPTPDWDRQRWVRLRVLVPALQRLLQGFKAAALGTARATPLAMLIQRGTQEELLEIDGNLKNPVLSPGDAKAWQRLLSAVEDFEAALKDPGLATPISRAAEPRPELRIRPPL